MIDKNFCMSSYLAFRYIEKEDVNFYMGLSHSNFKPVPSEERIKVKTAIEIGDNIACQIDHFRDKKKGVMLSGGMDSAIVASYLPGCDAYTFRYLGGDFQKIELQRADAYAKKYGLKLHFVDIDFQSTLQYLDDLMKAKGAPVHSIEPQIYKAAMQAQDDGIELMFVGESADLIFGGMDQLISKDWKFKDFCKRYTFTDPEEVLKQASDVSYLYERYRVGDNIDFLSFMNDVFSIESSGSYLNAFGLANLDYYDPYAKLLMEEELDLNRVRNGEPKYLIRELFKLRYSEFPVPDKIPMPRPVDEYFKNWNGPNRKEFKDNLNMHKFSGNQKWQLFCLERFLNLFEPCDN